MPKYYVSIYLWEVVDEDQFSHLVLPGADDQVIVSIDTNIVSAEKESDAVSILDMDIKESWTRLRQSVVIANTQETNREKEQDNNHGY